MSFALLLLAACAPEEARELSVAGSDSTSGVTLWEPTASVTGGTDQPSQACSSASSTFSSPSSLRASS